MKKLYTATDIENLAAQGQRLLHLGPGDILTPLARDRARELGLHLRSGEAERPVASSRPTPSSRPSAPTPGLAADAMTAFISLLQLARADVADVQHLAQCFDDLQQAAEQGVSLHLPEQPQPVHLSEDRRQALADQVAKLAALGGYLFGPDAPIRRFDILWTLTTLQQLTTNH